MSKILNFFVNLVTNLALFLLASLWIVSPACAITQTLQFETDTGYTVETTFSYENPSQSSIIREKGRGKTKAIDSLQVSFYDSSGELMASYDNIVNGVIRGTYFELNFDPTSHQLKGSLDLGGETIGEMYLKGEVNRDLSLILVDESGAEKAIARVNTSERSN